MRTTWSNFALTSALIPAAAAWLALFQPASAQTSVYQHMTLAGSFTGFDPARNNMALVSNNLWQINIHLDENLTNQFKFVANGSYDNDDWGENDQVGTATPFSGIAELETGPDNNIRHAPVIEGLHRFQFNSATRAYSVTRIADQYLYTNYLRNASFETAGSSDSEAAFWEYGVPVNNGGRYGDSLRADWNSLDGAWIGAIGTAQSFGGFWQDIPAGSDFEYEASGWFWADVDPPFGPWTAAVKEIKIEFYDANFNRLGEVAEPLTTVGDSWTNYSVRGESPAGTAWARIVVNVNGVGDKGSLQMDRMSLRALPLQKQTFNSWTTQTDNGYHYRGGWIVTTGRVTDVEAYDSRSLSLLGTNAVFGGGWIQSPRYTTGIGRVSFLYRHSSTEVEGPDEPLQLNVEKSANGTVWTPVTVITNIEFQSYLPRTVSISDSAARYVRIRHTGGNEPLLLDEIEVTPFSPLKRFQDFEDWGSFTTNGCYTVDGWNVCTGRISSAGAYSGLSAILPGSTGGINYVRSPLMTNGYGTISFYYARGTSGLDAANLQLQASTNGTSWTVIDSVSNILSSSYTYYERFFYQPVANYLRIVNVTPSGGGGGGSTVLLSEGFNSGNQNPDWTFNSIGTYTTTSSSGEEPPSLKFDSSSDWLESPPVLNPTNLQFWGKGQSASAASTFTVEGYNGSTWVTIATLSSISGSGLTYSYPVSPVYTKFKFSYTKDSGNFAFDDVLIQGQPPSGDPAPQELLLDNIEIGEAIEYRSQNFESWPRETSYGDYQHQGWSTVNTIISSERAEDGQAVRLRNATGSALLSHEYPGGFGNISFDARSWSSNETVQFVLQYSTNQGAGWSNLATIVAPPFTNDFESYSFYNFVTNPAIIRFINIAGAERAFIDNIFIEKPKPPADVNVLTSLTPPAPFTNDAVTISAVITPENGAADITPTLYYRIGSSGGFTSVTMTNEGFINYIANSVIPAQPAGTVVEYYLSVAFTGPGSAFNSPALYPEGAPGTVQHYSIPRAKPGQVWINEVKQNDFNYQFDEEICPGCFPGTHYGFVELAGPAGFDLSGWSIEVVRQTTINAAYNITNNPVLGNDFSGFGFWVLGNGDTTPRDQLMTNYLNETPVGIQLLNEAGGVEDAVSFGGTMKNFTRVTQNNDFTSDVSLSLYGTGLEFSSWSNLTVTPGAVNMEQYIGTNAPSVMSPPEISLVERNGLLTFVVTGNSNNWNVATYMTTNLRSAPVQWQVVTPSNQMHAAGTDTIEVGISTNTRNAVYRFFYTNPF